MFRSAAGCEVFQRLVQGQTSSSSAPVLTGLTTYPSRAAMRAYIREDVPQAYAEGV